MAEEPSCQLTFCTDWNLPMRKGWLKKKSPRLLKGWQLRYFVLCDRRLFYYKSQKSQEKLGVINFDLSTFDIQLRPANNPKKLILFPYGHTRRFKLKASSSTDLLDWAVAIHAHVSVSVGGSNELIRPATEGKFWKEDWVCLSYLKAHAFTGDLLLFKEKEPKNQQSLPREVIILKYGKDSLYLLYADSTGIPNKIQLEAFLVGKRFDYLAYRHASASYSSLLVSPLHTLLQTLALTQSPLCSIHTSLLVGQLYPELSDDFLCSPLTLKYTFV